MPKQMVFEQFMDQTSEATSGTLDRVPPQERNRLVGLLAELMSRSVAPGERKASAGNHPQTLPVRREVADHE